jgi:deazaflavin-dependent oxidoreductase (nitroreductase family)
MKNFTLTPSVEHRLRQGFKVMNRFMVLMWRLGLGYWMRWSWLSGQIMVITHVGRVSGKRRRTPVNFALYHDDVYCTAGFGQVSDWYRNIQHHPEVELWLPGEWWKAIAQDVSESEDAPERLRDVLIASGFAARVFGLDPEKLSREDYLELLKTYRLVHFQRTTACTGAGGPGDLTWIWPLALVLLFLGRRNRK